MVVSVTLYIYIYIILYTYIYVVYSSADSCRNTIIYTGYIPTQ